MIKLSKIVKEDEKTIWTEVYTFYVAYMDSFQVSIYWLVS